MNALQGATHPGCGWSDRGRDVEMNVEIRVYRHTYMGHRKLSCAALDWIQSSP